MAEGRKMLEGTIMQRGGRGEGSFVELIFSY